MEEDNFEESKREKNRNNFEELNNEIQIDEFEKLSIAKQRDELLKIKNTIQSFYLKNQMNYQIIDVKYNKLSDGKVVYEVVNRNIETNEIETKLFVVDEGNKLEEYKPIDAKEIEAYAKIYNIDIKEDYNKKAEIEKQDIENLDKNKSKKSLNELQEEVKQQAEIKDMENKAGLKNIEELTKINGDKKFDGNIKGYSSSELQGNEKVSSKFTLNQILGMQYANYKILKGDILFENNSIINLKTDERSRLGIFLALQTPTEIDGVSNQEFLRTAISAKNQSKIGLYNFIIQCEKSVEELKMNKELIHRPLNVGFSGGEKKKNEVLQIKLLKPSLIILDELDSGLDVDSLKIVCDNLNEYIKENPETSIIIITHYNMILEYIKPDYVHILSKGKIVKTGKYSLAKDKEKNGYQKYINDITEVKANE